MITTLNTIITAMTVEGKPFPFSHGAKSWLNYIGDNKKFPFCHLDTPLVNKMALTDTGYIGRTYPIKLFFMWKSQPDWTPVQHNDLAIVKARAEVNRFIARCQASPLIDEVKDASEMEVINLFDVNASGIILSVSIKPRNYDSACTS